MERKMPNLELPMKQSWRKLVMMVVELRGEAHPLLLPESHLHCIQIEHQTLRLRDTILIFTRTIINLYTKHWVVSAENFGVSFHGVKTLCNHIYGLF